MRRSSLCRPSPYSSSRHRSRCSRPRRRLWQPRFACRGAGSRAWGQWFLEVRRETRGVSQAVPSLLRRRAAPDPRARWKAGPRRPWSRHRCTCRWCHGCGGSDPTLERDNDWRPAACPPASCPRWGWWNLSCHKRKPSSLASRPRPPGDQADQWCSRLCGDRHSGQRFPWCVPWLSVLSSWHWSPWWVPQPRHEKLPAPRYRGHPAGHAWFPGEVDGAAWQVPLQWSLPLRRLKPAQGWGVQGRIGWQMPGFPGPYGRNRPGASSCRAASTRVPH